jgi:hypothetical protein
MTTATVDPDLQAEDDLEAGFEEVAPATAAEPAKAVEAAPAPKPDPAPAAAAPKAPEYVQITKEKYAALESAADKTVRHEEQLSKAFGLIGSLKQMIERQSNTTLNGDIEIGPEVFEELEKDFPELSAHTRAGLKRLFKGLKTGTGGKAEVDMDAVGKKVDELVANREMESLTDLHPDWEKIVGRSDKPDPNNDFRKWLGKQPAAYQDSINSTVSAARIARAIDRFKADQRKPAPVPPKPNSAAAQPVDRRQRIAGAVQPRGDGGPSRTPPRTANDDLEAGFNEG